MIGSLQVCGNQDIGIEAAIHLINEMSQPTSEHSKNVQKTFSFEHSENLQCSAGEPQKHSILSLLRRFRYECSMYLHINSRKHENIGLPINQCFSGVCCLETLKIKH